MGRRHMLGLALLLLAAAAGCADSYESLAREERNLKNELADHLTRISDEDSAQAVMGGQVEKMRSKWNDHKDRYTKYIQSKELGSVDGMLKTLERVETGEARIGSPPNDLTLTKSADGNITVKGKTGGITKDIIDIFSDPVFIKAMKAADQRLHDQMERIKRITPSGLNLEKASKAGEILQ
jgi:hypothetical protein